MGKPRCNPHRGAITQNLRHPGHDFRRVVANGNQGVCPDGRRMFDRPAERLGTCLLAEVREQRDVAAKKRLKFGADLTEHGARAHDDAADDAERLHHVISVKGVRCGRDEAGRCERGHGVVGVAMKDRGGGQCCVETGDVRTVLKTATAFFISGIVPTDTRMCVGNAGN